MGHPDALIRFHWNVTEWELDPEIALLKLDRDFVQRSTTW